VQYKAWDDWTDCFRVDNIKLPHHPFLGFSAMTGDVSDAHDIISVTSSSVVISPQTEPRNKHNKKGSIFSSHANAEPGTWLGFFFKLFLFAGVCAGGFYGWKEYQRRQRYRGFGGGGPGMGMPSYPNMRSAGPTSAGFGGPTSAGFGGPTSAGFSGPRSAGFGGPPSAGFGDYSNKRY
jgi:mannose-binding lectin 2